MVTENADKKQEVKLKKQVKVDGRISEVKLMNNPIVVRVNKFNEDAAKKFTQDMASAHNSGQNIIPIVIDSYGGQVYSLMSMISDIKSSDLPVATIVEGKAMSCGAVLFTFGENGHRYMAPDATVMIHDVSSGGTMPQLGDAAGAAASAAASSASIASAAVSTVRTTTSAASAAAPSFSSSGAASQAQKK